MTKLTKDLRVRYLGPHPIVHGPALFQPGTTGKVISVWTTGEITEKDHAAVVAWVNESGAETARVIMQSEEGKLWEAVVPAPTPTHDPKDCTPCDLDQQVVS